MLGVVGLSHLGIVSSVCAAAKGSTVIAYDPDVARGEALAAGRLPLAEPGLAQLRSAHRRRIQFTAEAAMLKTCSVILIAADVPTDAENRSQLSVIHELLAVSAAHAAPETVLVILSQVPPGFTRAAEQTLTQGAAQRGLRLYYQAETLVIGSAVARAMHPERYIVGCRSALEPLPEPYAVFLKRDGCPVVTMRYESAELAKIALNMFLAASVCTTNTLAELCEAIGADWAEIVPALTSDRRIGAHAYLQPGLGLSGGNLERDLMTFTDMARAFGTHAELVSAWLSNSRHRRNWVLDRLLAEQVMSRQEPVLAVWGLAYKPDTASLKNSPAVGLLDAVRPMRVRAHDPQASLDCAAFPHVTQVDTALAACEGADALAVMTPWREFSAVNLANVREVMRGRVLLDPFGLLEAERCRSLGFRYARLGVPAAEIRAEGGQEPLMQERLA